MKQAFETIKQLVADFKEQETAYLSPSYQESQIRQDFIDKFFTALGWDVTHTIQKNPYQQEVHIENKVHMAGSQRRADYAFFLAPNFRDPKFFVEAKKPSRNLANADDYYQTIRYGWNANTPIAILTDFEEFHILDCRFKPNIKDVMIHKIEYFHYSDYANEEKFSRIYWLFSREAVANGSLEKRKAELPKLRGKAIKGGYQPVDEAFLEELDNYREVLAKAFKKSNPYLQSEELTEAIQRIIDRLVFIRFLEDKQIEEPEIIQLASKKSAWKGFLELCKRLDPKYNGLIFKSHKVLDGKEFVPPDDEEFAAICCELSDTHSPYNFDQIPISILGSIYERFLGKVVHATDKRVKVEEKPEVRKAGGVYYTPEYIVRYIVNETVGKLLYGEAPVILNEAERSEEAIRAKQDSSSRFSGTQNDKFLRTPEQIAQMAFADIACGSGSFLIEVYNVLLDYHIRYYLEHPDKQKEIDVFERDGKLHLTLKKKKEILLNNIYGVDIDFQATEVTQLSLYLKLLEDVTMHDAHQFGMFKETILPDLRKNIINGNSLIGRDILDGQLFADVDENKLKPMNFEDAFPVVMKRGGFDAVVGNPPYVRMEEFKDIKDYLRRNYSTHSERADIFYYFFERSIKYIKVNGCLGYIVSNTFARSTAGFNLRQILKERLDIIKIAEFGDFTPFANATVYPLIIIGCKSPHQRESVDFILQENDPQKEPLAGYFNTAFLLNKNALTNEGWIFEESETRELRTRLMRNHKSLLDLYGSVRRGIVTGLNDAFIIDEKKKDEILKKNPEAKNLLKPYLAGEEMDRWSYQWNSKWLIYTCHGVQIEKYNRLIKHFEQFKKELKERATAQPWYELQQPQEAYSRFLDGPKIIYPDLSRYPKFSLDKKGMYFSNTGYFIASDSKYLLGLLNSKLLWFVIRGLSNAMRGGLWRFRLFSGNIEKLPIRIINFEDAQDKSRYDAIVKLVEQMLEAKEKLSNAKTESETNRLESLCQTLDRQIDEAVYELYGLTPEEIAIVEGKSS